MNLKKVRLICGNNTIELKILSINSKNNYFCYFYLELKEK